MVLDMNSSLCVPLRSGFVYWACGLTVYKIELGIEVGVSPICQSACVIVTFDVSVCPWPGYFQIPLLYDSFCGSACSLIVCLDLSTV